MNNNIILDNPTMELPQIKDGGSYVGKVDIKVYEGDSLLSQYKQTNKGLLNLFQFITYGLQGNWENAKSKRPCKIVLLQQADGEILTESSPTDIQNDTAKYWSSDYEASSPVYYDTAALATNDNSKGEIVYHFRIPFLSLTLGAKISKLMLLPNTSTDYANDACAYLILKEPIQIPLNGGNYTIIIDWKLSFSNAETKN